MSSMQICFSQQEGCEAAQESLFVGKVQKLPETRSENGIRQSSQNMHSSLCLCGAQLWAKVFDRGSAGFPYAEPHRRDHVCIMQEGLCEQGRCKVTQKDLSTQTLYSLWKSSFQI